MVAQRLFLLTFYVAWLLHGVVDIEALSKTYRTAYHFQPPKNWMNDPNEMWNPKWDPQLICSQKDATISGRVGPFGLKVLASKYLDEYTAIFFTLFKTDQNKHVALLCSDQSRSSLDPKPDKTAYGVLVDVDPSRIAVALRTLIDHSVIESYGGNGKGVITSRVYPTKAIGDAAHLYVFNNGEADVTVSSLTAWTMKKANIY